MFAMFPNHTAQKEVKIVFTVLHPNDDDIQKVSWILQNPQSPKYDEALSAVGQKLVDYEQYGDLMKDVLFYRGLSTGDTIRPSGDLFSIRQEGFSRLIVDKKLAKEIFMREKESNRNFLRGGLEVATFLGIGKGLYILGHDSMIEDWDFDNKSLGDFKRRILTTEQMRFDDNAVSMNWGHAYAGVLYYSSARNNGFSSYESLMITLASSSVWEYLGEYKEVVSINDQIITGIGGSIIGETLYQISNMLKQRDSQIAKIMGAMINPVGSLNDILDGKSALRAHENFTRKLGFDSDGYSSVDIISGIKMASNRKDKSQTTMAEVGFGAEVINMPIEEVGNISTLILDPMMAELFALGSFSKEGIEDWQAITKLALGGYFSKNIKSDKNGNLNGHSFFIAPAMRTEYTSHGPEHSKDFYAMVNIIGATMDITFYTGGNKIRFTVDVYGDFAMVRPYGLDKFDANGGDLEHAKSVLSKRGYYYAVGATGIVKLSYEAGKNEVGVKFTQHEFDSIDNKNLNRHIELVTDDVSMKDSLRSFQVYYTRSLNERYKLSMGLERIFRSGDMKSVNSGEQLISEKAIEDRMWLSLKIVL